MIKYQISCMEYANFIIATVFYSKMQKSQQKVKILPWKKGGKHPGKCGINVVFDLSFEVSNCCNGYIS